MADVAKTKCSFKKFFKGHRYKVEESLDLSNGLLTKLLDHNVITKRQHTAVKAGSNDYKKIENLIDILLRRPKKYVSTFCDILIEDEQTEIVKLCYPDYLRDCSSKNQLECQDIDTAEGAVTVSHIKTPTLRFTIEFRLKNILPANAILEKAGLLKVASINDQLFVLRSPISTRDAEEGIKVFDGTDTFRPLRTVQVPGLPDGSTWNGFVTCRSNNCLYVSNLTKVFRIEQPGDSVTKWRVDGWPTGLSVNSDSHVLVTCYNLNEIREYTTTGSLVRAIKLQQPEVSQPLHAVELTNGQFAVSHHGPEPGVSLINEQAEFMAVYRFCRPQGLPYTIPHPCYLALLQNDIILVADCGNNRIVKLDSSLSSSRELHLPVADVLKYPSCVCFDEVRSRLYVCTGFQAPQRLLIIDNVDVTDQDE